jgi:uncharacterized protein YqiB (DUF1249 family)
MLKKKYTIDLAGQMAECEANYARIMKLLPDFEETDQRLLAVELPDGEPVEFCIEVKERCKYTTMVDISQFQSSIDTPPWTVAPFFSLRIYHDAQMAEVVAYDRHRGVRPSYEYPNDKMYHRDEKVQLNTFLGEWLSHCLKYGRALDGNAVSFAISE